MPLGSNPGGADLSKIDLEKLGKAFGTAEEAHRFLLCASSLATNLREEFFKDSSLFSCKIFSKLL